MKIIPLTQPKKYFTPTKVIIILKLYQKILKQLLLNERVKFGHIQPLLVRIILVVLNKSQIPAIK